MSEKILEVKHLGKAFGSNQVLRDIDFSVSPGDVTCIIGPSGSGKSTLLRCLNMLETPSTGEINYHGTDITSKNVNVPEYRSKVGMVFQNFNLFNNMTALKNCTVGQVKVLKKSKEEAEKKALYYLEKVGMAPYINAKPKQLSGGQKQRVALARMMASQPEILLLDEPLSALDSFLKWQVEEELQDLLSEIGKTVLFVSHSRDEVYHLCDRICVLEKGHMETIQEKKEFFANPVTQAAARISGCRNIVPAKRLSAHQLEVPDWGICFELEKEIPEDISFVGVRAHYIEVSADLEPAKNSSIMQMDRLLEQQFESELVLKYNQDTMSLRILMDKEQAEQLAAHEKLRVTIPEHALLLLKA